MMCSAWKRVTWVKTTILLSKSLLELMTSSFKNNIPFWMCIANILRNKFRNGSNQANGHLIRSARTRIAKVVNQIYNIINSLPADHQLNKQQLGQIFGAVSGSVGTFMGLFNTFKIKKISAGVGKKINTTIDITKLNTEHLDNLQIFMNTILNIITAMLKETQLLSEIKIFLENAHKCNLYHQHGPTSTKQKTFSGFINT